MVKINSYQLFLLEQILQNTIINLFTDFEIHNAGDGYPLLTVKIGVYGFQWNGPPDNNGRWSRVQF